MMTDSIPRKLRPQEPVDLQFSDDHLKQWKTLPKNLQIPRNKWKAHPNYRTNYMGSWMRSHDTFRRHAKGILDGIRTLDQTTFLTALGKSPKVLREQFEKWHNNMGSHERYEESRLYPFAARRWDVDTRYLTSEHGTMHSQRDLVLGLFAQLLNFEGTPAQYGTPALACAVAKLEATMADYELYVCVHLAEEEEFIVPMFLELTVEEYKDYEDLGLTELFRKMDQQDKANGVKTKGKRR